MATHYAKLWFALLSSFLCAVVPSVVSAQSATQARFVLDDIDEWLPGIYDNASQVYLGSNFGVSEDGNHPWLRLEITAYEGTGLGQSVFLKHRQPRDGDDVTPSLQLVAFAVDEPMRAVRMDTYQLPAGTDASSQSGEDLSAIATLVNEGCPVYWRRGSGNIYGAMQGNWCEARNDDGMLRKANMSLTADQLLIDRGSKNANNDALMGGRADEIPLTFKKVIDYECYVVAMHQSDDGLTIINPFFIDDGGGQFFFETKESPPRQMEVYLRRSLHPSNSGENFLPMIHLYLYPDGTKDRLASSWAHEDSGIVGFASPGVANAGCKLTSLAPERSENP